MSIQRQLIRYAKPFLFLCLVLFSLDVVFMAFHRHSYLKQFLDTFKTHRTKFADQKSAFKIVDGVDLRIIVLTFDRPESLARCLSSLNEAEYGGDKVIIDVWVDRAKGERETIHPETYRVAKKFTFRHGEVKVHNHSRHVGLHGQWLNTWDVQNSGKEIAIFIEDDTAVSRHFYKWLKAVHKKYARYPNVNGFSTQGVSIRHSGDPGYLTGPADHVCFLYPVLGTWGFSPNRQNWLKFIDWYTHASKDPNFQPHVPGILPSKWYSSFVKRGRTDRMWSIWHIYYAWKNTEYTLYPNLPGRQGLTINWKEKGLNYNKNKAKPDPLLQTWESRFVDLPDKPPVLDYTGAVVIP
ncbi:uncharacterized protein LOC121373678 [Gigantopelta aegis]|uniref:uncharacterized protein LOC121373678 n=1 Tax=Gigantopelta aegis TaxID=1735272 RepID=UPI001B88AC8B|nr:uncharacterized protein LOC121373678 [Gigantopelta aegis]